MRSKFLIGGVLLICVAAMWLFTLLYQELLKLYENSGTVTDLEYSWVLRLLLNLVGYSTVLVPGFILYKYLDRTNYFDKISTSSYVSRTLYACFGPYERLPEAAAKREAGAAPPAPPDARREVAELLFCFTGLMGAYLIWGLLQEKIMTQSYRLADGSALQFRDSQVLVFINRLAALLAALARLACSRQPLVAAPLYQFSYCALSNVVSAWCQYEALNYVSFPMQVLSKSCKVLPVMAMGALVSRLTYSAHEYITAALISLGMVLFMMGSHEEQPTWSGGTLSGLCLLALYMWCDAFTSSWQAALFARHAPRLRATQMLVAVNLSSCALTAAALAHRQRTAHSLAMLQHPALLLDVAVLSASSAAGQLLIYRTIAKFGAVVFTIIMTLRQAMSILLSCVVYSHRITAGGAAGVLLVFGAVLLRVYCTHRMRQRRAALAAARGP